MVTFDWLPSEQTWLADLSNRVLTGEITLIRALPRWGMSAACKSISVTLESSAVVVDGRSIIESNQAAVRDKIKLDIAEAIENFGCAQLIFDNYGHALKHSQGGALHSMLYGLLVDSDEARDIGALFVARSNDILDFSFSGSPLISRAETVVLPILEQEDARVLGFSLARLTNLVGESTWLARRFLNSSERQGRVSAVEHLSNDRRRIAAALSPTATEVLAGARATSDLDPISRETLMCLGYFTETGEFETSSLVDESRLRDEIRIQSPGWPSSLDESVKRFAELLEGAEDAIWVDRYLFSCPPMLGNFLFRLRELSSTRLRLLISDDRNRLGFAQEIASVVDVVDDVKVRFMNRNDRHRLHDRHLILSNLKSGYVIPTAGVILGRDDPGSAVSVPMPALAIDYAECWRNGTVVRAVR